MRRCALSVAGCLSVLGVAIGVPAVCGAYAVPGPEPTAGSPGLPDGRIYEEVSPANKYGNAAGGPNFGAFPFMTVSEDGNGVFYSTTGAVGESGSGYMLWAVAKRSPGMWSSSAALPRPLGGQGLFDSTFARSIGVSTNLERTVFSSLAPHVAGQAGGEQLFLAGAGGKPAWSGEPLLLTEPRLPSAETWEGPEMGLVGASSDLHTVYFTWPGTLVPGDNAPDPLLEDATRSAKHSSGYYEWRDGALSYAGTLPNGTVDPYGASYPTRNICMNGDSTRNQVSSDGTRAFFVSPMPESGAPPSDPTELYVHETAGDGSQRSVLVSRDTLLAPVEGLPAAAPNGPTDVLYPSEAGSRCGEVPSFSYASPDGSHVLFESVDRLTAAAPEDQSIKTYEFDVAGETLTYLPGVTVGSEQGTSAILASTADGSRLLFEKRDGNHGEALELDMWSNGPEGPSDGLLTPVVQLPGGSPEVGPARLVAGGSVAVFQTTAALGGFDSGGFDQVYRYSANDGTLTCVSCPPTGKTPSGPAYLTHDFASPGGQEDDHNLDPNRGVSEDGSSVYFDTPDALVPQDVNGKRDVYEWRNGSLFLVSTGISREDSFFGDNSPGGGDVVFSTDQGLAPGDTDEAYDVYDARIPRPGDNPPPGQLPCVGDVCQGPPSVPTLLGTPASASFSGLGNPPPAKPAANQKPKRKVHTKRKAHNKKRKHGKRRRARAGTVRKSISKTKGNG